MTSKLHLAIVIMAAGKGTRMNSQLPKVLHQLGGISMVDRVLTAARAVEPGRIIVVTGYGAEEVETAVSDPKPIFARQMPQLGTGHAVQQALPHLPGTGVTVILNGDTPLIRPETIERLVELACSCGMALLTVRLDDATGYGRIIRDKDNLVASIVEHKDATDEQKQVNEVYTGMMAVSTSHLHRWLNKLDNNNAQGEYYLTDIVQMAFDGAIEVGTLQATTQEEVMGVNSPEQLQALEEFLKC